jgi:crossover junction endodeoxyribonuclease RusA
MILKLPYPPSGNLYWKHWRGRVVTSPEAKRYRQGVKLRALTDGVVTITGPVCLSVWVYRPRKQGDLDNALKVLIDSLRGVAFEDDSQIVELHAARFEDKADPRVMVFVKEVPP